MNDAFGYLRCALTNSEIMMASIAFQNDVIVRAAAVRGLNIRRVFIDVGMENSTHAELNNLLDHAAFDDVCAIVVSSETRLSRCQFHMRNLQDRFLAAGLEIIDAEGQGLSGGAYRVARTQ
jgi:hypothetical protein